MANNAAKMVLYEQRRTNAMFVSLCRERAERQRRKDVERRAEKESVDFQMMLAALETKLKQKKTHKALQKKMTAIDKARKRRRKTCGSISHQKRQRLRYEINQSSSFEDEEPDKESVFDESQKTEVSSISTNENFSIGLKTIDELMEKRYLSAPFCEPVDYEALEIPDYPEKIKKPMDLGTIRKNILENRYNMLEEVWEDIELVWNNCRFYNGPYNPLTIKANALSEVVKSRLFEHSNPRDTHKGPATNFVRKRGKTRFITLDSSRLQKEIEFSPREVLNVVDSPQLVVGDNVEDGGDQVDCKKSDGGTAKGEFYLRSSKKKAFRNNLPAVTQKVEHIKPRSRIGITRQRLKKTEKAQLSSSATERWSSKLGALSGKMESFEVESAEDGYSSTSSSADDNENIFQLVKEVTPSNAMNSQPFSSDAKHGWTVIVKEPDATTNKERVLTKKVVDPTGEKKLGSEKALDRIDHSLWSTSKDNISAEVAKTVVKKYSPVFIDEAQASPEPNRIPMKSPKQTSPGENFKRKAPIEFLKLTKSCAWRPDSDQLNKKQQHGDPIKTGKDTEIYNHFEQADILDDLFS